MLIYTISKNDLRNAYFDNSYDFTVQEFSQPIDPVDYDVVLLQIMLKNHKLTQTGTAA